MSGNIIDRGIERIKTHGWAQGMTEASRGPKLCMMTSLGGDTESPMPAIRALCAELQIAPKGSMPDIEKLWAFNDDPSTTLEDVLLVLKRASARLDEQTS